MDQAESGPNRITLNIKAYQSEMSARQKESERFEKIKSYDNHLDYRSLDADLSKMEQDTTLREKRKRWHESLAKDVYLEEAINILLDLKTNNIRPRKVAKINH